MRATASSRQRFQRILRPFCGAIQFTEPEQFSAFNFLGWLHHIAYDLPHSLLGGYRGARDELIFAPLGRYLTSRTATIRTQTQLNHSAYAQPENRVLGFQLDSGESVQADAFVLALPAWLLPSILPEAFSSQPFFAAIRALPTAPAISVQLWFDRAVIDTPDFYLVGRSLAPVYQEQSTNAYPTRAGNRISVNLAPADDLLKWSDPELVRLTVDELTKVQPQLSAAAVTKSVVIKHPHHLLRPLPGIMSARPPQTTPVPNLFLAGDWTQQDYFGSQEGAVRSGRLCAERVLASFSN